MKFDCGLSEETRQRLRQERRLREAARLSEWHDHFAWWPVLLADNDCRWLETVERKARDKQVAQWLAYGVKVYEPFVYREKEQP